ncbi:UDP-glycosyltransferase 73C2-like protein [Drosera capensis]
MTSLHILLFPLMAQGHMIPMIDMAKLMAKQGPTITIITTPGNALRFRPTIVRATEAGLRITIMELKFPSKEVGLPEGCENFDMLPSLGLAMNFMVATGMLEEQLQEKMQEIYPRPDCLISDMGIEVTRVQLPHSQNAGSSDRNELRRKIRAAEEESFGVVVNSFEELETEYVKRYKEAKRNRVWCLGPVSLCNKDDIDMAERGNKAATDGDRCLKWLDSFEIRSVVYACLGSLNSLVSAQLVELGLGLEASNKPFIWVLRGGLQVNELEKWMKEDGFEERIEGRGLIIRGWAPQVLILSHPAIGVFLTHCGWNSTLEAVSAGLPMVTWPMFSDQFLNEKLVVEVLKTGVGVGVEAPVKWGEEANAGVMVKKDDVRRALKTMMDEGDEGVAMRRRAREIGKSAHEAIEGGSSEMNLKSLIQEIEKQKAERQDSRSQTCLIQASA